MDSAHADELLRHARFARGLARGLLRDDSLADDAVQETWLAAVRRPPRMLSAAWIGAVARNAALKLRRGESRRTVREAAVATPESSDAAWSPERQAIIREVVDAVLSLDEPMRSAVLMRFYEDLPPRVIAERQNVSVNTVNSRLQRALAALRERLDARDGGRGAWAVLLSPLGGTGGGTGGGHSAPRAQVTGAATAAVEGGIVVALGTKLAIGAAALAVAAGLVWWLADDTATQRPAPMRRAAARSDASPRPHEPRAERPRAIAPEAGQEPLPAPPVVAPPAKDVPDVAGRVEAPAGAALTDGFAYVAAGSGDARTIVARSPLRADGTFAMSLPRGSGGVGADVEVGAIVPRLRRDAVGVRLTAGTTQAVTLHVTAGSSITGTVVTTDGVPIPGVKLLARPFGFDPQVVTSDHFDTDALLAARFVPDVQWARTITDASGRFVLEGLGDGKPALFSESPAWFLATSDLLVAGAKELRIVARAAQSVTVRVRDAKTGAPIDCHGQVVFRRRTPGHGAASSRGVEVRRGELWAAWDKERIVEQTVPAPEGLPPGTVTAAVRLEADGYQIRELPIALDGAAAQILDAALDPVVDAALGRVRLTVVDARGAPVDHEIQTTLYEASADGRSPATKRLSKSGPGKFVLAVTPGKWHLAVSAADASAGDIAARTEIEVVAGASSDVEVALPPTGFVVVRRRAREGALPDLVAEAADVHGNSITTSTGDAELKLRLAPGRWTLTLGEGDAATKRDVDVRAFEEVVVDTDR